MAAGLTNIHDQRRFIERLTDAILWCRGEGSILQPRTSLRTCKPDLTDMISQDHQVFRVCLERTRRLTSAGMRIRSSVAGLCGGRLLSYLPDDHLFDGIAQTESEGFFDVNNIPPYDSWVWKVRNIRTFKHADGEQGEMEANDLVAWVPPDFMPLASRGVEANPEGCMVWLDALYDEFVQSLRRVSFFQDALTHRQ